MEKKIYQKPAILTEEIEDMTSPLMLSMEETPTDELPVNTDDDKGKDPGSALAKPHSIWEE